MLHRSLGEKDGNSLWVLFDLSHMFYSLPFFFFLDINTQYLGVKNLRFIFPQS